MSTKTDVLVQIQSRAVDRTNTPEGKALSPVSAKAALKLRSFRLEDAERVATWAPSLRELRWLAPSTDPPLTPDKVAAWRKDQGLAYCLCESPAGTAVGYAELNPMRGQDRHLWLGHVVIDPARQGCGLGTYLVRELTVKAFSELDAVQLSLVVFPDNVAAIHCYLRSGFRHVGEEFHRFGARVRKHRLLRMTIQAAEARLRAMS